MPTETKAVCGITLDLVPLEIGTVANAKCIGGRDHPKSLRWSFIFLPPNLQLMRSNRQGLVIELTLVGRRTWNLTRALRSADSGRANGQPC